MFNWCSRRGEIKLLNHCANLRTMEKVKMCVIVARTLYLPFTLISSAIWHTNDVVNVLPNALFRSRRSRWRGSMCWKWFPHRKTVVVELFAWIMLNLSFCSHICHSPSERIIAHFKCWQFSMHPLFSYVFLRVSVAGCKVGWSMRPYGYDNNEYEQANKAASG